MIELEGLTKRFPAAAAPAVDALSLEVGAGEICVLIGPSGCGKTTTMRMINRMIEPDAGRIRIDGRDVTGVDPVTLRRSVGYVIQQVGLFPHMSIADNVATVPRLLGWDASHIAKRVDELLALVHMDPDRFRDRYPRELSGGQKQRVGVARALAADPPAMLMDEPFGALDPITRTALQDEFLRILRELKKTIVFVTHDIDEALKMGSRVAILRAGRLVQYARPEALLARPADDFVAEFVGADRALKRLALLRVADYATAGPRADSTLRIAGDASLRDALAAMLAVDADVATVVDRHGAAVSTLTLVAIRTAAVADLGGTATLRQAEA
ncbi:MAG: ABC transporter ATP-binding protein [Casimicrobiaceae bacterium]